MLNLCNYDARSGVRIPASFINSTLSDEIAKCERASECCVVLLLLRFCVVVVVVVGDQSRLLCKWGNLWNFIVSAARKQIICLDRGFRLLCVLKLPEKRKCAQL